MRTKSSFLLIIVITGMFALVINQIPFVLSDTHIEGHITQDTTWTLTDSPYVIIRDVTIDAGATLTIEPGVEVRFGGNFSLVVEGKLIAIGTEENSINFTSNKLQPEKGDWNTISFTSMQPSYLEHCVIEYAKNGTVIQNGNLLITQSSISNNLQSGVYITGDNNAIISENRIETNLNGILIDENSSGVTIRYNIICNNVEKGIYLNGNTTIDNILILSNTLSTNPVGIHIYRQVSANITRNSIAYNELGILYENATDIIPLQFNDIYENKLAAMANTSDPINAEHNYWGDAKGPYHESLNPYGKGNRVESNGTDLDFIPFLTINNSYLNQRPIANLLTDKLLVVPNDDITFIGTFSTDDRQVYRYFFDFGDGKNSSWTTLSIFKYKYNSEGTYFATLRVMDDFGVISENVAITTINVQNITPLHVHLELSNYTVKYGESVSITVQVTDGANPIDAASMTLISVIGGTFQPSSGLTDSGGHFAATFTAPNPSKLDNIRIIATASKSGYADGSDYRYLRVLPPIFVEILIDSPEIESLDTTSIRVNVTSGGEPIGDAYVRMRFDIDGNVSQISGYTNADGFASFNFTAPLTLINKTATVTAIVTKIDYASGEAQTQITIYPRKLDITLTIQPSVASGETATVIVYVTHNGTPISSAVVSMTATDGAFSQTTGLTDFSGTCIFFFTAPRATSAISVSIFANATKGGYASTEKQVTVNISPEAGQIGGLPLTTIALLIAVPILIVVIAVILIKLKIIEISPVEEEEEKEEEK